MATFTEFGRFCKKTNFGCDKSGIYAIQPNPIQKPPIKVGMAYSLIDKMRRYDIAYPYGYKILGVARVPSRDPNFAMSRDLLPTAEKHMLDLLKTQKAHKKEWMRSEAANEVDAALKAAHVARGVPGLVADGKEISRRGNKPERRLRGKQTLPKAIRIPRSAPDPIVLPPPVEALPVPKMPKKRNQMPQAEMIRHIAKVGGTWNAARATRSAQRRGSASA